MHRDEGGFGAATVRRAEGVSAVYRMLGVDCSSPYAFKTRRKVPIG